VFDHLGRLAQPNALDDPGFKTISDAHGHPGRQPLNPLWIPEIRVTGFSGQHPYFLSTSRCLTRRRSRHVRFAPIASQLRHCSESTRSATSGCEQSQQALLCGAQRRIVEGARRAREAGPKAGTRPFRRP
jgi:hypothetical protein